MTSVLIDPALKPAVIFDGTLDLLGGNTYEELADWRDKVIAKASENERLIGLDALDLPQHLVDQLLRGQTLQVGAHDCTS